MVMSTRRTGAFAALAVAALLAVAASACAPLNAMDDVFGTSNNRNSISGEVRSVDTRRGRIQIREQYGRDYTVRYDSRTRVIDRQRPYPVSSLERGDFVQMRIVYDRNNTPWADRIEVRDSRGSGRAGSGRDGYSVQRYDGSVRQIDVRRGYFTLDRGRGASLVVRVPDNARRDDIRRFERLRRNDRVRVEVRVRSNSNQADLVRFR
jgi:hypothetical protein